ncbi:alkaline phosphatase D family protein [Streptomonospora litoralis]|uniref:PhoD-like phosphatase n=1 Tax=Streptomonospora litoralis TaxID=2498135 RepID=A0A4P6Q7U5_9ACTN|nr:alkaline phosphatase D family protein [Streptomonospora litoralis]QBI56793.1 PhoD-like phosphatase [Streptomonospora litoralis]
MSVEWVWAGAGTDTSIWVRGKVTGSSTRLAVSTDPGLASPLFFGPVAPTAEGVVSIEATGLATDTRYYYAVEDDSVLDTAFSGTFRTHPLVGEPASFVVGAAGDAGLTGNGDDSHIVDGVSNHPVFDTMRDRALAEEWVQFVHLGDAHYRNIAVNDHALYRDAFADLLTYNGTLGAQARQGRFFRDVGMAYVWDDHDYGPNNSDSTHLGRQAAAEVYREIVPHYPLAVGGASATNAPIAQAWQIGRVQFLACDVRWARDPNSVLDTDPGSPKTMLGVPQKIWMEQVLRNSSAKALVLVMPSLWLSDQGHTRDAGIAYSGADYSRDSFRMFRRDRQELVELLGDTGWLERMVMLQADKHALSISSGPNNPWGGFPLFMLGSLDAAHAALPEGQYDQGQSTGRDRYGTLRIVDSGHTIALHATGYIGDTVWRTYTGYAHVAPHVVALDYAAGQTFEPLSPVDDDQQLSNDVTAERSDGGEHRVEQTTGPLGTAEPPAGVGRYSDSVTVNVYSDDQLADQAGWRVHKGTVDQARYPQLHSNLTNRRMVDLRDALAGVDAGDQIHITNPPPWLPPEAITAAVEGYDETITTHEWHLEYNASPAAISEVAETSGELVLNSEHSFEVYAYGWESTGSTIYHSRVRAYRGSGSLVQVPDGTSEVARVRTRWENSPRVHAGTEYHFGVWAYSTTGHDVDMSIEWFDVDGTYLGFPFILLATPTPVEEWTYLQGSSVAPEGAWRLRVNINQRPTPADTDLLWLDEAVLSDGTEAGPNRPNRADTSGSALVEAIGAEDTQVWVATVQDEYGGSRWINADGATATHATEFPFDVRAGGEVMRVTHAQPAAWDLFRNSRGANTWGTSESGTPWAETAVPDTNLGVDAVDHYGYIQLNAGLTTLRTQLLDPGVAVGDCEVLWSIRVNQISPGGPQIGGLVLRHTGADDFYQLRVHFSHLGAVNLSVARGETQIDSGHVTAPPLAYDANAGVDSRIWVRTRIIGHRVLARVWHQRYPSGETDLGAGLDLGHMEPHHWMIDRTIPSSAGRIDAGQLGFSAVCDPAFTGTNPSFRFQLAEVVTPQSMTVQRSINTVSKDHPAGTGLSLDRSPVIGL